MEHRIHAPAQHSTTDNNFKRLLHMGRGAVRPLTCQKCLFQTLKLSPLRILVLPKTWQFILIKQGTRAKIVLQPLVQGRTTLGVRVGFKRHGTSQPTGVLLLVARDGHHVRRRQLLPQRHVHHRGFHALMFLNEGRDFLLPQRLHIVISAGSGQLLHSAPHQFRPLLHRRTTLSQKILGKHTRRRGNIRRFC